MLYDGYAKLYAICIEYSSANMSRTSEQVSKVCSGLSFGIGFADAVDAVRQVAASSVKSIVGFMFDLRVGRVTVGSNGSPAGLD